MGFDGPSNGICQVDSCIYESSVEARNHKGDMHLCIINVLFVPSMGQVTAVSPVPRVLPGT